MTCFGRQANGFVTKTRSIRSKERRGVASTINCRPTQNARETSDLHSKALLFSRAFAVGAFRTFLKTIRAFGKVRTFLRLDLLLICGYALSQSARGLLAFFC
jgi:hypothetical protein